MQCHALQCIVMYVCIPQHTHIYIYDILTLHCITLHYITLHYIALHYIALHYITLHCITLHYIHTMHEGMIHQMIGMASHHATCSTGAPRAQ